MIMIRWNKIPHTCILWSCAISFIAVAETGEIIGESMYEDVDKLSPTFSTEFMQVVRWLLSVIVPFWRGSVFTYSPEPQLITFGYEEQTSVTVWCLMFPIVSRCKGTTAICSVVRPGEPLVTIKDGFSSIIFTGLTACLGGDRDECLPSEINKILTTVLLLCIKHDTLKGGYCVYRHFQQYFSYIGGGNWSTRRKPPTCRNSLANFIT
jgi:hypothetical protein